MPHFNKEEYTYLYAAILDGSEIAINGDIPEYLKDLLMKMLSENLDDRPDINHVFDNLIFKTSNNKMTVTKKKGFKVASSTL